MDTNTEAKIMVALGSIETSLGHVSQQVEKLAEDSKSYATKEDLGRIERSIESLASKDALNRVEKEFDEYKKSTDAKIERNNTFINRLAGGLVVLTPVISFVVNVLLKSFGG